MNPMQTAAVAPVNWNASQILGIKFAAKKIRHSSVTVIEVNLMLSEDKGLAVGNRRLSKLTRSA